MNPANTPVPGQRNHEHGNPVTDKFIPDDTAMIMDPQVFSGAPTQVDADNKADENQPQVSILGKGMPPSADTAEQQRWCPWFRAPAVTGLNQSRKPVNAPD